MSTTKLQLESESALLNNKVPLYPHTSGTKIQSLLCGLSIRGWLTNSEKNLFERIAPENGSIFLMCDGQYLYPKDIEFLSGQDKDYSVFESRNSQVSHRLTKQTISNESQNIQTAVISNDSSRTIILGIASSQHSYDEDSLTSYFSKIVEQFRKEYQAVIDSLEPLIKLLVESQDSVIIVDRSSGCMMAVNDSAASLLGKDPQELLEKQFCYIKDRLGSQLQQLKLSMTNMTVADLNLTAVTITRKKMKTDDDTQISGSKDEPSIPGRHLVHRMRNSLCAVTSGISHLQSIDSSAISNADSEILVLMNDAIWSLCYQIDTFDTLVNFQNINPVDVDIKSEVNEAIKRVTRTMNNPVIHCQTEYEPGIMTLQPSVLSLIVECTLRSHLCNDCTNCKTVIDFVNNDNLLPAINIESDFSRCDFPAAFSKDWLEYISSLENLLQNKIAVEQMQTRRKLITRLSLTGTKKV